MKQPSLPSFISISLLMLSVCSCDFLSFQNTDAPSLDGLNELKETIITEGQTASETMPPFIYRHWFGYTSTQQPIDSLYLLKNRSGELIEKYAITRLLGLSKSKTRQEFLVSNGKYFYFECDEELNFYVSEFVDSASDLQKPLKMGRYINIASKPDNW